MRSIAAYVRLFLLPLLAATITICFSAGHAAAEGLSLYGSDLSEYMVCADPGEDPHLKIEPGLEIFTIPEIQTYYSSSVNDTDPDDGRSSGRTGHRDVGLLHRVKYKFRMIRDLVVFAHRR